MAISQRAANQRLLLLEGPPLRALDARRWPTCRERVPGGLFCLRWELIDGHLAVSCCLSDLAAVEIDTRRCRSECKDARVPPYGSARTYAVARPRHHRKRLGGSVWAESLSCLLADVPLLHVGGQSVDTRPPGALPGRLFLPALCHLGMSLPGRDRGALVRERCARRAYVVSPKYGSY